MEDFHAFIRAAFGIEPELIRPNRLRKLRTQFILRGIMLLAEMDITQSY